MLGLLRRAFGAVASTLPLVGTSKVGEPGGEPGGGLSRRMGCAQPASATAATKAVKPRV